jgi:uncharacterized repeat protein (TIGR03803 family)
MRQVTNRVGKRLGRFVGRLPATLQVLSVADSLRQREANLRRAQLLILGIFCSLVVVTTSAQTFQTVVTFNLSDGSYPTAGVIQGSDGNYYGTTLDGAPPKSGEVFRVASDGTLSTLYDFCSLTNCADGGLPFAGLVQGSDSNFYGTTYVGGTGGTIGDACGEGCGTVFQITSSGALTTLYSFCPLANCPDGALPTSGLIQGSDGAYYGTTSADGTKPLGGGTVFKITSNGALATLYRFCTMANCADGSVPYASLVQGSDGNFYGMTYQGGSNTASCNKGCGTIYVITPKGSETAIYSFCSQANCSDGSSPTGALVQGKDGNFYGMTNAGGAFHGGTVFRVTPSGVLTTLHNFCSLPNCADGNRAYSVAVPTFGGLIQGSDGNFYGTTAIGGTGLGAVCAHGGCGTVFQMTPSGTMTTLHNFCSKDNCPDGGLPIGALIQASDGTFYGTTASGGSCPDTHRGCGTVFSLSLNVALAPTFTPTSVIFDNQPVSSTSPARLVAIKNINTGIATLDFTNLAVSSPFAITHNTCGSTLAPGQSCAVKITFTPTTMEYAQGSLSVYDNVPGSPQIVALSGSVIAPTRLTPGRLPFAPTLVGDTGGADRLVTLRNNLPTTLTGISYSTTAPFNVYSSTCSTTLNARESCTLALTFSPTKTGWSNGTLTVGDSANNSPQTVFLTGLGKPSTGQVTLLPASLTFGGLTAVGATSGARNVFLFVRKASVTDISISTTGPFNYRSKCPTSLNVGQCTIRLTFTPTQSGTATGTLNVSDSGGTQTVSLTGTGTAEAVFVFPASVDFGDQSVGTTSNPTRVNLFNEGSQQITVTSVSASGGFAIAANYCMDGLKPNSHCSVDVVFSPTRSGALSGTLTIVDNATGSPQTASLSGTGD